MTSFLKVVLSVELPSSETRRAATQTADWGAWHRELPDSTLWKWDPELQYSQIPRGPGDCLSLQSLPQCSLDS